MHSHVPMFVDIEKEIISLLLLTYRDFPVEMKYQRPHIVLNHYQEVGQVNSVK
jgi:hypothetical protein